jgi:hypothetical protein
VASFALVITDLVGANRAFLDASGIRLTRKVNGACTLEFTAYTDDPNARELLIGKRAVKLYRDGVLRFMGLIGEPFTDSATELAVAVYDPFKFLEAAHVGDATLVPAVYDQTDAGTVAWDLINALPYETHLEQGTLQASVKRDRTYDPGKGIAEAITQLAEVDNGFAFRIDAVDNGGATFASFNALYPLAGVDRPDVRYEYGDGTLANIDESSLKIDRLLPVNDVVVTGAGVGEAVPAESASSASSKAEYGTFPAWDSASDVSDTTTLLEHATGLVVPDPPVVVQFDDVEGAPMLFDDFDVGDTVGVYIDNGRTRLSGAFRVNQATLVVDDDSGAERLTGLVLESPTDVPQEVHP